MSNRLPIIILLSAIAIGALQYTYYPHVSEIDLYSLISEIIIAITVLMLIFDLRSFRGNKQIYVLMLLGFVLLFFAFWTDMLDEIIDQPRLMTTIFEDLCQMAGFITVIIGISKWTLINNRQNKELQRFATTDSLTGLFVRRYFNEKVSDEFIRCRCSKGIFSILLIDFDNFKSINDKYGHSCGDDVLSIYAKEIKKIQRETDVFARWGGEEFIVLAIESNIEDCANLCEKLRQHARSLLVAVGDEVINFTVSIGAATLREDDDSVEMLINRADQLLYKAKRNGRNCFYIDSSR